MNTVIFLTLSVILLVGNGYAQKQKQPDGRYDTLADCEGKCKGLRDARCVNAFADETNIAYCQCQGGYYSNDDQCDNECEDQQYWSLFTYGKCQNVESASAFTKASGVCNQYCVFRVRVWATVFIIILFFSAVILLVLMLPGFVTSCYTCCFLKKQKRRMEEDAVMASVQDPHGTVVKGGAHHQQQQMAMHQGGWQYPFYGWPYYGQQGR